MTDPLNYVAEPTAARFHADPSLIRLLMGPLGCGKSVACCMELFRVMANQEKGKDGYRRTRMVCIRNTYPELLTTTLKTWKYLFPTPQTGRIVHGTPIVHYFEFGDIRSEVLFMSLNSEDNIKKLKSLEITMAWINEAQYLFKGALDEALSRTPRYPPENYAKCTQRGVIMDTNPPDDDHWIYKLFEEQKLPSYRIFKYPPAIQKVDGIWVPNPKAENIKNLQLGYDYYLSQVPGKTDDYINVLFCGNYGTSYDGRPVYPEYNDHIHYDPTITPNPQLPLILGWDYGLTPSLVVAQMYPNGQLVFIDELCTEYMGITNFAEGIVRPHFSVDYPDYKIWSGEGVGDPSGVAGHAGNEQDTCFTVLRDKGFPTRPARTNKFLPRKESISRRLLTLCDGKPALVVGPRCKNLRRGFLGGYHFRRLNVVSAQGETKYTDEASKNQYSHPHDAAQYIAMEFDNFKTENAETQEYRNKIMRKLGYI